MSVVPMGGGGGGGGLDNQGLTAFCYFIGCKRDYAPE